MDIEIQNSQNLSFLISGFRTMSAEQMSTCKQEHGLFCQVEELLYLAQLYRTEYRDPTLEELTALDKYLHAGASDPGNWVIPELKTDSPEAIRVWNDLMAKRKALRADSQNPPAYADIPDTANRALWMTGFDLQTSGGFTAYGCITDRCGKVWMRNKKNAVAFHTGNGISFVIGSGLPVGNAPLPGDRLALIDGSESLVPYLSEQLTQGRVRSVLSIGQSGILDLLRRESIGASIELTALSSLIGEATLETLLNGLEGYCLVRLSADLFQPFADQIRALGGNVVSLGQQTEAQRLTITRENHLVATWSFPTINRLFLKRLRVPFISFTSVPTVNPLPKIPLTFDPLIEDTSFVPGFLTACYGSPALQTATAYAQAQQTFINTLSDLFTQGIDTAQMRFSCVISCPGGAAYEIIASALLGLYRVGMELCMPICRVDFLPSPNDIPGQTRLWCFGFAETSEKHSDTDNNPSCLSLPDSIPVGRDGNPYDFDALRKMLLQINF